MARFLMAGYRQIGMDYFALPDDELAHAVDRHELHRNFMGYTTRPASDLVGAGPVGDRRRRGSVRAEREEADQDDDAIDAGRFPIERGYLLDEDDKLRRFVIAELMCNFRVELAAVSRMAGVPFEQYFATEIEQLAAGPMADGLATLDRQRLELTMPGRLLVRNVAMIFDRHLRARTAGPAPVFSRTV